MITRSVNNDTREEVLVAAHKCPDGLVLFPVAAEAMRSLASSAQGAAASTEQMSSAIGRIATSNNIENYRAFVAQMQRDAFYGMGIPEHMGGGPLYGRHSPVFIDTPAITPSPAPKQKLVSPFSIGLGQRSIEV